MHTEILIVGGSVGGCAAAIAATRLGKKVILTEESDWIGGQLTSQAVPPDEHRWIEHFGCTRSYRQFRDLVRKFYKEHYPLLPSAQSDPHLNPGNGSVSRLCHEPRVAVAVLDQMFSHAIASQKLDLRYHRKPIAVEMEGDQCRSVTFANSQNGESETITADYILDATELGDLLPMANVEYVVGAESQSETGEPHAIEGDADAEDVQSFTWCFAMSHDPESHRVIDKPTDYDLWRDYVPQLSPAWSGKMLSWSYSHPITLQPIERRLFPNECENPRSARWIYRRLICKEHYSEGSMPFEATLVNWPQNDYVEGNIIDQPEDQIAKHLSAARQLSLSFFYWMQTDAPRPDGGVGYPGLFLRPDLTGTDDGLAKMPYIRESRRIRAEFTVTENHVGTDARQSKIAENFDDSVGIGCYRIDLHPSSRGRNYIDISSLPFQIPLGSLIPIRVNNLLPSCKNIGTTHITNGCYRLHPVEWNIGESVGMLAAFCIDRNQKPREIRSDPKKLREFQNLLRSNGVELEWQKISPV